MRIILIVDDEDVVRRLIRVALQGMEDVECIEATDADEALEISKRYRGRIHLLVTDVMMPGAMSGAEMAMKVSDARPETRIVLMSGNSMQAVKIKPGWRFVQKPFGVADIRETVGRVLSDAAVFRQAS